MIWEKSDEEYRSISYRASFEIVAEIASGLVVLGLKKGDRVVLLSEGRNDWILSELGILFAGGINVPLSTRLQGTTELRFRISQSGSRYAIVYRHLLDKILDIKNDLPELEKMIVLEPSEREDRDLISMRAIRNSGKEYLKKYPDQFEQRWQSINEKDTASICYTSGTTADPKGIVLTHRNYTANIEQAQSLFHVLESSISLITIPWDHSFAHTCGIYTLISCGASIASIEMGSTPIETVKNIGKNIKEIKPHFLLSVPTLSRNFKRNIERGISSLGSKVEKFFHWGLRVAYAYQGDGFRNGKWQGHFYLKPLMNIFDKVIFSRIREQFGGRLEFFIGGGALLDIEYQRFFSAIGMPIYQGYGLSEASPVISTNFPGSLKMGTSGRVVPHLNIKICGEEGKPLTDGQTGEIVVKGENVMMGYWRNREVTEKSLRDGWLYTGDLGYIDEEGYLVVLGRSNSLLISNDGEKYSPEGIEGSLLVRCPFIHQILLVNDQKPYTTALIVPDKSAILATIHDLGLTLDTVDAQRTVISFFVEAIKVYQTDPKLKAFFPGKWLPSTFALLGEPFSEANRFLNSTLKMVRNRIAKHYQDRIDFMYTTEGKHSHNAQNMKIVARMEK